MYNIGMCVPPGQECVLSVGAVVQHNGRDEIIKIIFTVYSKITQHRVTTSLNVVTAVPT